QREEHLDALITAYLKACDEGTPPERAAWLRQHPEFAAELSEFLDDQDQVVHLVGTLRVQNCNGQRVRTEDTLAFEGAAAAPAAQVTGRFGDYELLEILSQGAMGVVYRARQVGLNRIVALKMIRTGELASAAELQRFQSEARLVAMLD